MPKKNSTSRKRLRKRRRMKYKDSKHTSRYKGSILCYSLWRIPTVSKHPNKIEGKNQRFWRYIDWRGKQIVVCVVFTQCSLFLYLFLNLMPLTDHFPKIRAANSEIHGQNVVQKKKKKEKPFDNAQPVTLSIEASTTLCFFESLFFLSCTNWKFLTTLSWIKCHYKFVSSIGMLFMMRNAKI